MQVVGPTMTLRPPAPDDAEALYRLGSDPEVTQWFSWGPYTSIEQPVKYIADAAAWAVAGTQHDLLVVSHEHGPIGITGISEIHVRNRTGIVGSWLGREYWGTGANTTAKALVLHFGFAGLGLERIGSWADVRNGRSQAALEKVGFQREGVLRGLHRHGDVQKDVVSYGMLKHEFVVPEGVVLRQA